MPVLPWVSGVTSVWIFVITWDLRAPQLSPRSCHPHGDPATFQQNQARGQTPALSQQEGAHSLRLLQLLPEKHLGLLKGQRQPQEGEWDPSSVSCWHGPGGTQSGCGCLSTSSSSPKSISWGSPLLFYIAVAQPGARMSLSFGDNYVPEATAEGMGTRDPACCHPSGDQPRKGESPEEQRKLPVPWIQANSFTSRISYRISCPAPAPH